MKTYIFADNLLQSMRQDLPGIDLDVFFNVSRLGLRETHDDLEEFLAVRLGLRHRERPEALEIPTDAIFLLHRKPNRHQ